MHVNHKALRDLISVWHTHQPAGTILARGSYNGFAYDLYVCCWGNLTWRFAHTLLTSRSVHPYVGVMALLEYHFSLHTSLADINGMTGTICRILASFILTTRVCCLNTKFASERMWYMYIHACIHDCSSGLHSEWIWMVILSCKFHTLCRNCATGKQYCDPSLCGFLKCQRWSWISEVRCLSVLSL